MTKQLLVCKAVSGRFVRLTENIWFNKILNDHPEFREHSEYLNEVKETIENPEYIVAGWSGELLAMRHCKLAPKAPKHLCIVYRESDNERFVIPTFVISKVNKLLRRGIVWSSQK